MNKVFKILPVALAFGAAACGVRTTTTDVNPRMARAATCVNAVEVYDGRADVRANYYELAWINAEGNSVWTTDNQMRETMRKRSAEVGANGLIANPVQQNKAGVSVVGEAIGANTATAKASGLAIWIPSESGRATLACGSK
ncbi:MAG: hypothetical protein H0U64_09960 [Gemmatimonadaceae bacterium]|nr:hypothetical protein [Gemmatimonadaceae bacterium]